MLINRKQVTPHDKPNFSFMIVNIISSISRKDTDISRLVAASLVSVIMISFFAGVIGISSVMYMFVCCYRLCTVFNREKYR